MPKKIKYTFQAVLRPDGKFIDIEDKYYTPTQINDLRIWADLCWKGKYRWKVVGSTDEIENFFDM